MEFFTADICDAHFDKVQLLGPGYQNYGGAEKCEGEIVTVKLDKHNGDLITLLRDVDGKGKVVVVDVAAEYYAVVGENLMKFANNNGYAGIVINGYVRDTQQIEDIPVALIAKGTCSRKYMEPLAGEVNVDVSFDGVDFKVGAYLYADRDGVIVCDQPLAG